MIYITYEPDLIMFFEENTILQNKQYLTHTVYSSIPEQILILLILFVTYDIYN